MQAILFGTFNILAGVIKNIEKLFQRAVPLEQHNRLKVFILFWLFFFTSFVYNILLPLKKTLIIYMPGAGSESIAFLKIFFMAPLSLLLTSTFLMLSRKLSHSSLFYSMIAIFIGYFVLYVFWLNPQQERFACDQLADVIADFLPSNYQALPALIRYWMHTLFYSFAELWFTIVVSVLVWSVVNETSTQDEAKISYPLFMIGGNVSGVITGVLSSYCSSLPYSPNFYWGKTQWEQTFFRIMLLVFAASAISIVLYSRLTRLCSATIPQFKVPLAKEKASLQSSLKTVSKSKNLGYITLIVLGYNVVYMLSEFVFLKRIELTFAPDRLGDSNDFISKVATTTAIIATFFSLFVNNISIRYAGWRLTALITPFLFMISGFFFYAMQVEVIARIMPFSALEMSSLVLYVGVAHIALLRGARYSVFDTTKEMAYIGLSQEERVNGKALIDGVVSRLGKTAGSVILCILLGIFGNNIMNTVPCIIAIVAIIASMWMKAVLSLAAQYPQLASRSITHNRETVYSS